MDAFDISTPADATAEFSAAEKAAAERARAAAAQDAANAAASSLGVSLGLSDPMLDEGKKAGTSITSLQGRGTKRPKVTHSLFFDNDNGLKKILRTFPTIKLQGKGHEYQDISLLIRHYRKWFQDLYPYGDHFEDLVWKARQVLEDKEKEDDGTVSDPRERLHAFRFQYKNTPAESATTSAGAQLSDEARARIEANRQRALELKRQREAKNNTAGEGGSTTVAAPQELDMEELWRIEEERAAAERQERASQRPAPAAFDDEEDDPFGFGGGFDDDFGGSAPAPAKNTAKPVAQAPAPPAFDEEEDVFGFGCDFDDAPPPSKPTPAASQPGAAPEAPKPAPAPAAASFDEEDEDAFGFMGGGFDDP